jgi:copper chaperone CopZ
VHPLRLATAPAVHVLGSDGATVAIRIDGLVCGACAARTASALRAVRGVEAARVDLDAGRAEVSVTGEVSEAALEDAVGAVVVAPGARRLVARMATWWRLQGSREGRA